MLFSGLNVAQIIFIIVVPIVLGVIIFLAIYFPVRNKRMKTEYKYYYYKRIYKLAMDKDYYLINNFLFKIDDSHVARIDHILFGDKYIYIISDSYFPGDIDGKENDPSIILINKQGKKNYEDNPLNFNKRLTSRLSLITGINPSLMIGICMINDNCHCSVKTTSKSYYIIQNNKFKKLVRAIESRDIGNINKDQLANAVKAINKLNRRKRKDGAK